MRSRYHLRQFIFRYSWWIAIAAAIIACGIVCLKSSEENRIALLGSSIAGSLAFLYFIQQQKLAEITLFKQLFTEFNQRYNDYNGPLSDIFVKGAPISFDDKKTVIDYFNLCAEEYLFYDEGYIRREVWRAWCRGMLFYLEREPFRSTWDEEVVIGSYYGLTLDIIKAGAS